MNNKLNSFVNWCCGKGEYPFFKASEKPYIPMPKMEKNFFSDMDMAYDQRENQISRSEKLAFNVYDDSDNN